MKEVDIQNDDIIVDNNIISTDEAGNNGSNPENGMTREERIDNIVKNHKTPFTPSTATDVAGMMFTIAGMFPEYDKKINDLYGNIQTVNYLMAEKTGKKVGEIKMGLDPHEINRTQKYYCGPDSKKIVAGLLVDLEDLIKEIKTVYSDKKKSNYSPAKLEHLSIIEKLVKFAQTDDYEKMSESTPLFSEKNTASYTTMPTSSYLDKNKSGKDSFTEDTARYEEMMKKYPFFKQIKDANTFIIDKYAPYNNKMERGELTDEEAKSFKKQYRNFLNGQKKSFAKIKEIKQDNAEVIECRTIHTATVKTGLVDNWQNRRLGDVVYKEVDRERELLDRGWAVGDLPFLLQLDKLKKRIEDVVYKGVIRKEKTSDFSEQNAKDADKIMKKYEKVFNKLNNSFVRNPEERKNLLLSLQEPVRMMNEWAKSNVNHKLFTNEKTFESRDTILLTEYNKAVTRKVTKGELGSKVTKGMSTAEALTRDVNQLVEELKNVEISRFRKPSTQFGELKEELLELQDFAKRNLKNINGDKTDITDIKGEHYWKFIKFAQKAREVMEKADNYLLYKAGQIEQDPGRVTDAKKQSKEQPRIRTALHIFDKLKDITENIDKYVYKNPHAFDQQDNIDKAIAKAELRLHETDKKIAAVNKKSDYQRVIMETLIDYQLASPEYYVRLSGESLTSYKNRVNEAVTMDYSKLNARQVKKKLDSISMIKYDDIVTDEGHKYSDEGTQLLEGKSKTTLAELKATIDQRIANKETSIKNRNIKKYQGRDNRVGTYHNTLVNKANDKPKRVPGM